MKALEVSGITFSYDQQASGKPDDARKYALRNFTLSVDDGEMHALLGPNGAGKTTSLRIITGQLRGYTGEVALFGRKNTDRKALAAIGYAPQPVSLFTSLTALENLHFFGVMADLPDGEIRRRSGELLETMGLAEYAGKLVSTYSGGMLRRLNLAVALLHAPGLLLLDEPTAGVDPQSRHHIYETLRELNTAGITILLSTHIMEEAERLCSRLTLVDGGAVVFDGKMADIDDLEKFFLEKTGHRLRDE